MIYSPNIIQKICILYVPYSSDMFRICKRHQSRNFMIEVAQRFIKAMSTSQPILTWSQTAERGSQRFPVRSEVKWQAGRHRFKSISDLQAFQRRYCASWVENMG